MAETSGAGAVRHTEDHGRIRRSGGSPISCVVGIYRRVKQLGSAPRPGCWLCQETAYFIIACTGLGGPSARGGVVTAREAIKIATVVRAHSTSSVAGHEPRIADPTRTTIAAVFVIPVPIDGVLIRTRHATFIDPTRRSRSAWWGTGTPCFLS